MPRARGSRRDRSARTSVRSTRASQWMLDSCMSPSAGPTPWQQPSRAVETGGNATVDNRESIEDASRRSSRRSTTRSTSTSTASAGRPPGRLPAHIQPRAPRRPGARPRSGWRVAGVGRPRRHPRPDEGGASTRRPRRPGGPTTGATPGSAGSRRRSRTTRGTPSSPRREARTSRRPWASSIGRWGRRAFQKAGVIAMQFVPCTRGGLWACGATRPSASATRPSTEAVRRPARCAGDAYLGRAWRRSRSSCDGSSGSASAWSASRRRGGVDRVRPLRETLNVVTTDGGFRYDLAEGTSRTWASTWGSGRTAGSSTAPRRAGGP